jgi:hypothetical protein
LSWNLFVAPSSPAAWCSRPSSASRNRARIDAGLTHVWNPLLHEIAANTLSSEIDNVKYLAHAKLHHFFV